MKLLRLKICQPHAHYRIPFTFSRRHTYPIPPYSTIIGFICNILGIKDQSDANFKKLKECLSLAIYGKFKSMIKEYNWLRNLNKNEHIKRFGFFENRCINQIIEHPGLQMPTRLDVLADVKLIIYIHHQDEKFLEELKTLIENPVKRNGPLHIGRSEDWIVFDGSPKEAIKIIDINENKKKPFYGKFDYYTWIPDAEKGKGFIDKSFYDNNFYKFFRKIKGSLHLITSFYEIKDGFRNFIYIPVKLFEQGDFPFLYGKPFRFVIDDELYIPIFLCKLNGGY